MQKIFSLILLLSLFAFSGMAQSRSELEKQRNDIQRQIEDVKRTLNQTQKNRKASLGQLALLQRKLKLREAAINNINKQINSIQGNINNSRGEITKLKKDLDTLKMQYAKSVVYAYRNRNNYDFLNFIFSAQSFNDALKRVEYLKTYRRFREQHASNILTTQELLQKKIAGLESARKEKSQVLTSAEKEKMVLVEEKKEKDQFVAQLKSKERELNKELVAKKRADDKLRSAIRAAIEREARLARLRELEELKKKEALAKANAAKNPAPATTTASAPEKKEVAAAPKKTSVFEATPEGMIVSDNFEKNKGRLPWPVEQGIIKTPFGNYGIEGTKIVGNNPGITIETASGASVKSVFDGDVSSVFDIEGVSVVLVRHGKYFTTYSGLSTVSVSKGAKVKAGQVIGKAGPEGEIDFLLLQENRNQNPETWLRRK
ncbi:MAG: murein hydrolase activator EnvC family protein [Flavitalea sp.]